MIVISHTAVEIKSGRGVEIIRVWSENYTHPYIPFSLENRTEYPPPPISLPAGLILHQHNHTIPSPFTELQENCALQDFKLTNKKGEVHYNLNVLERYYLSNFSFGASSFAFIRFRSRVIVSIYCATFLGHKSDLCDNKRLSKYQLA